MGQDFRPGPSLSVELPGIEPGAKMVLNWENGAVSTANARQSTWHDLRIRRDVLIA
jgi:hypothetical protein